MKDWQPQRYRKTGRQLEIPEAVLDAASKTGQSIIAVNRHLAPVFTLRHLAHLANVDYRALRTVVSRKEDEPYRVFAIRKRAVHRGMPRFRMICVPVPALMTTQRWIAQNILNHGSSQLHSASTAYAPGCGLIDAATRHCAARWLIKIDIESFFESISEIAAYRAFRSLAYQPLVAFELARLCTRLGKRTRRRFRQQWQVHRPYLRYSIDDYSSVRCLGHLPQGAPTSPMLANLAMVQADRQLTELAGQHGLIYSRYADDLTFSTDDTSFDRDRGVDVIHQVYRVLGSFGFSPNIAKTRIIPPRARKVVLGLLVNHDTPRLPREFKMNMRMHLYYLKHGEIGPARHAARRGFIAVSGLRRHLFGLASYATQVEPAYGDWLTGELKTITWPT